MSDLLPLLWMLFTMAIKLTKKEKIPSLVKSTLYTLVNVGFSVTFNKPSCSIKPVSVSPVPLLSKSCSVIFVGFLVEVV